MRKESLLEPGDRDDRKLEPFRAVQRHHQDARVARAGFLVHVGEQRQLIDEAGKRRLRVARLVLARGRDQLREVLDPAFSLLAPLLAQVLQVAALVQDFSKRDREGLARRHLRQRQDQVAERRQRLRGARRQQAPVDGVHEPRPQGIAGGDGLEPGQERRALAIGRHIDRFERLHHALSDAARRHVDDPPEADVVVRIEHELQVGERVLDLLALVEADAADDLVRDAGAPQRVFQRPRLGVGSIQHGDCVLDVLVQRATSGPRDELGLVQVVAGAVIQDLRAALALRVEPLVLAVPVLRDDG